MRITSKTRAWAANSWVNVRSTPNNKSANSSWTRHPAWIVLNSPIVVLLIGAIIIGGIGTVFTASQRCITEAELVIDRHSKLAHEILNKRIAFSQMVISAKSLGQLRKELERRNFSTSYTYLEFQGRTIRDLEDEEIRLASKLNLATTPALEMRTNLSQNALREAIDKEGSSIWDSLESQNISRLTSKNLSSLKGAAKEQDGWAFRSRFELTFKLGVPACGLPTVASRLISGHPTYIATLVHYWGQR